MKKIYFLFFLVTTLNAKAQYDYFANDPQWHVHFSCAEGPYCFCEKEVIYEVTGDTLIGSTTYKKMGMRMQETCFWAGGFPVDPSCAGTSTATGKAGFLRQDDYKIYRYAPMGDELLYDFDLEEGDTLANTILNSDIYVVDSIDTLEVNGEFRKRFYLGNTGGQPATFLIDGVGSSRGLLEPMISTFECGYALWCYRLNGDEKAFTPNACNFTVDINEQYPGTGFRVFPNPSNGSFELTYVPNTLAGSTFCIYNALGKQVKSLVLSETRTTVDFSQTGIYFYSVFTPGGVVASGKIVVTQ